MTEPHNLSRPEDTEALYRRAIETFGRESQADAIIEEAAELIFAICKHKRIASQGRLDAVIDEIADMEIALAQAKLIYSGDSPDSARKFEDVKRRKLEKLASRLESHQATGTGHESGP